MAIITAMMFTGTIGFSNINMKAFAIQHTHGHLHTCVAHHPPFHCCPKNSIDCHCKKMGIDTVKCTYRLHHK